MTKRKRSRVGDIKSPKASDYEDSRASKLQFKSHEDLFDSEDEFMRNREKILLDDKPEPKKRKHQQEQEERKCLEPYNRALLSYYLTNL